MFNTTDSRSTENLQRSRSFLPQAPSILSPQTWPFGLDCLPPDTFLVGGNVRDALLGRQVEYLDLDFVLSQDAVATADAIASRYQAGFVVLDMERQIARVVFPHATADFALQVGDSLISDLKRRDFTVNAIAYDPFAQQLFDPLGGYQDLQRRQIRMIDRDNLEDDPLRLLRAYRQSAQLNFQVEAKTEAVIQELAPSLEQVAAERVQSELNYLLSTLRGGYFLRQAWSNQLLRPWLPHATSESWEQIAAIDRAVEQLKTALPQFLSAVMGWMRDQQKTSGTVRSWLKIAKLSALIAPDLSGAEEELRRLKYSRMEEQAVLTLLRSLPTLRDRQVPLSAAERYHFFREVGNTFPAIAVAALAQGVPMPVVLPLMQAFLDDADPTAHPRSLLTGRDLMRHLQLRPSPKIGSLLEALQLAQAEGKVQNPEEAIAYVQSLVAEDG